jgi:hypothetical protein
VHAMKEYGGRECEVPLLLNVALGDGEWLTSGADPFTPAKILHSPLNRGSVGPGDDLENLGERKTSSHCREWKSCCWVS